MTEHERADFAELNALRDLLNVHHAEHVMYLIQHPELLQLAINAMQAEEPAAALDYLREATRVLGLLGKGEN